MNRDRMRGIDRTTIKWIAIITMLIDHIGHGLVPDEPTVFMVIGRICNIIGRNAFPLFLFLLADGFLRTKSKPKFFLRLFLFAVISEVPFDLVLYGSVLTFQRQNVLWTLLFLFGYMWVADLLWSQAREYLRTPSGKYESGKKMALIRILTVLAMVGACLMAFFARTDYGLWGVWAGIVMYHCLEFSRRKPDFNGIPLPLLGYIIGLCILLFHYDGTFYALPTILLIWNYYGKCEKKFPKWLGYAFYPAHLSIIAGIEILMGKIKF